MKLGPVTKLDQRNKIQSCHENDNEFMSENYDVIVIFLIYGLFGAMWKPDSGRIVYKKSFINSSILSYSNWKQN